MQEKRISEPHFTHGGSMSRPLVWRSGIVHRLIRQMAPASYGSTIRKMWQPTRICPYTLKLFRPARSSPLTLMHCRAVASGGSREVRCQFDTSEENCLPRRRRVFGRQLVAEPGQSNWLRSQLESTFGVSSLDRRKIQDPYRLANSDLASRPHLLRVEDP